MTLWSGLDSRCHTHWLLMVMHAPRGICCSVSASIANMQRALLLLTAILHVVVVRLAIQVRRALTAGHPLLKTLQNIVSHKQIVRSSKRVNYCNNLNYSL